MCFDSLMKNFTNCLLADYSTGALLIIPANPPKILLPSGISVLQSFDLSPALCPSENTKEIFINPPHSSKQIDQFLRYELVECGASAKYLENIPLSLSLWLSIVDMASSEKCQCWVAVRCSADGISRSIVEPRCSRIIANLTN